MRASGSSACTRTKALGEANGRFSARLSWRASTGESANSTSSAWKRSFRPTYCENSSSVTSSRASSASIAATQSRKLAERRLGEAAFGGEAGAQPFERAADLDRVGDVALGEGFHREAAGGDQLQQALFLEPHQRHADRRARHAEALDDGKLGDAVAGFQLAGEDQVAQAQQRLDGLRRLPIQLGHTLTPGPTEPCCWIQSVYSGFGGVNARFPEDLILRPRSCLCMGRFTVFA